MKFEFGNFKLQIGKTPPTVELGATGTEIWDGFIIEDYNTDLQGSTAITTYDKMRKGDGMVKAVLLALELPIRSAEWSVGGEDVKEEHIEFIKEALFKQMSISFDDWLHHALLMFPFGFSMFEKVFKIENGRVWWQKLAPRLPKSLYKWLLDEDGGLTGITQWVLKGNDWKYIDIPVDQLLIFSWDREGSNYEGTSVLRAAYKHWFIKELLYKIAGMGLERQAMGLPVINMPQGFSDADKTAAINTVKRLRGNEESGLVLPQGFEFDIKEGKLNSAALLSHIRHHDTMIAKAALAQFLQLGQEKSGGAFALSKDQSDFFLMALGGACKTITDTMNRHAIPQLIDYNFGKVKKYPELKCMIGKVDEEKLATSLKDLVDGQIITPDGPTEAFMRKTMGLPEADKKTARPKIQPAAKFDDPIELAEGGYWRKLTKWEKGTPFKVINDRFDSSEKALIKDLSVITGIQTTDVLKQVERIVESEKVQDLFKLTVKHRGEYADTLRGFMKDLANFGNEVASAEAKVKVQKISIELERWLRVKADTVVELHAAKMKSTAMLTTLNSINSGESTAGTLFNVKSAIGDYVNKELKMTSSIVVSESINQGRNEIVKSGEMKAAQYSAILDERTCPLCEDLDEKIVDVDDPDFKRFTPPVHANCRCVWVYIRKEEERVKVDWTTPNEDLIKKNGQLVLHEEGSC